MFFWVVCCGVTQHVTNRLYQLGLTGDNIVVSSLRAVAAAAAPLLSLHSSPSRLLGSSSVLRSLLLWHLRHKQWHTPMIPRPKCTQSFQSQLILQTFRLKLFVLLLSWHSVTPSCKWDLVSVLWHFCTFLSIGMSPRCRHSYQSNKHDKSPGNH